MMVFTTHCSKSRWPSWLAWLLAVLLCVTAACTVRAEGSSSPVPDIKLERNDEGVWLSTTLKFELPGVVEDALLKGIPVHFVADVDVFRDRWYWFNRKVSSVQRRFRLAYHPLTRRWRLNVTEGEASDSEQGLTLNQNFENLQDAMNAAQRFSHWRIADASHLEAGAKHWVEFRFRLDVAQLPRPLQIGTLGQSDWQISMTAGKVLPLESAQ